MKKIGGVRTSLYNKMSLVFTIIVGYIFIEETFGVIKIIGGVIIFVGMYIIKNKREDYDIRFK